MKRTLNTGFNGFWRISACCQEECTLYTCTAKGEIIVYIDLLYIMFAAASEAAWSRCGPRWSGSGRPPSTAKRFIPKWNRSVWSSLQLDILPHPLFFLIMIFFPKISVLFPSSPIDIHPNSLNIIGKMLLLLLSFFSMSNFFHSHEFYFPSSKLDILPQQTW